MNNTLLKDSKGNPSPNWYFRAGEPILQDTSNYIVRIYSLKAETINDLNKEPSDIFVVVKGGTEEQALNRAHKILDWCNKGFFNDC